MHYFPEKAFAELSHKFDTKISVFLLNVKSLRANFKKLKEVFGNLFFTPKATVLTETWLDNEV